MNEPTPNVLAQPLSRLVKQPVEWMMILTLTIFLLGATWFLSEAVISKTGRYQFGQLALGLGASLYRLDTKSGEVELFQFHGSDGFEKFGHLPAAAKQEAK